MKDPQSKEEMIISSISNFYPASQRFCIFLIHPNGETLCIKNIPDNIVIGVLKYMSTRASKNYSDVVKVYCRSFPRDKRCAVDLDGVAKMVEYIEEMYPDAILTFLNIDTKHGKLFKYCNGEEEKPIASYIVTNIKNNAIKSVMYDPTKYRIKI